MLDFLMDMNTLLDEIPTYDELDFLQTKAALTVNGEESRKSRKASAILKSRVSSIY